MRSMSLDLGEAPYVFPRSCRSRGVSTNNTCSHIYSPELPLGLFHPTPDSLVKGFGGSPHKIPPFRGRENLTEAGQCRL